MPEYCTCGAKLPEDARFCHKCGKPQYDYPEPEPEPVPVVAVPVAAARVEEEIGFHNGIAVRVSLLTALVAFLVTMFPLPPLATMLRLLVCVVAAGFLAVFIYRRRTGRSVSIRAGVRLGWMTGIFSFAIITVLMACVMVALPTLRQQLAGKDPNIDQFLRLDPVAMIGTLLAMLVVFFVLYTVLSMLGGALGAKVLEKD